MAARKTWPASSRPSSPKTRPPPAANALKVIPVPRINGVIVIANSQAKVRRAIVWIKRLDQESITDPNYYVYAVQNGNAVELARSCRPPLARAEAMPAPPQKWRPTSETTEVSWTASPNAQTASGNARQPPQGNADQHGDAARLTTGSSTRGAQPTEGSPAAGTRITPNPANNTIVIRATPQEYRKILATLRQIDAPATQVLINTTIAEVTLNNELRYGVQAYFHNDNVAAAFFGDKTTQNSLTLKPYFPGMNFFIGSISDPQLVIDALSGITNVRVVSSPSLLVLENETATIKVGDQVPVQTQTLTTDGGNRRELLRVPRYRRDPEGEAARQRQWHGHDRSRARNSPPSARKGTTAGNNPTFSQRSINSKVSVNDQQTVLLGGLISGRKNAEGHGSGSRQGSGAGRSGGDHRKRRDNAPSSSSSSRRRSSATARKPRANRRSCATR